jgi:hypothetical protein
MTDKSLRNLAVLFFLIFSVFASCGQQETGWGGTIEEVDGVKVVSNPNEPLYGELVFELEEDLSIGNEEDDNYLFYGIGDIQVDKDGNIYVLERRNVRVQKFDKNGNYICTIGKKGQGPGEFLMPMQMLIDDRKGTIGVQEQTKLIIFDKNGKYLDEDLTLEQWAFDLVKGADGNIWGTFFQGDSNEVDAEIFRVVAKFDSAGKVEKEVAKYPHDVYREAMEGGMILSVGTGYEYGVILSEINDQNLIYGYSAEYEFNVVDLDGNIHTKIKKEEPYRGFSAEEKGKYKKGKLPEHKPFFYDVFSDSEGRIYVQRNMVRKAEAVEKIFDIFSKDGYYLYKAVCQDTPWVIKDGYYYTRIANDETGEVFVKRYKIKNWDEIKTGII